VLESHSSHRWLEALCRILVLFTCACVMAQGEHKAYTSVAGSIEGAVHRRLARQVLRFSDILITLFRADASISVIQSALSYGLVISYHSYHQT
jgi:hypothetical protein